MAPRLAVLLLVAWGAVPRAICSTAGPFRDPAPVPVEARAAMAQGTAEPDAKEPQRLVAAVLAVTLGPFAAHRLYLGTDVKVPIIYGLTFGGFGLLVLIDLGHILFTKDLAAYQHNNKVFMWGAAQAPPLTPP